MPRTNSDWEDDAACIGMDVNLFYPKKGAPTQAARKVCEGCPVQPECLYTSVVHDELHGIWGGASRDERKHIARKGTNVDVEWCARYLELRRKYGYVFGPSELGARPRLVAEVDASYDRSPQVQPPLHANGHRVQPPPVHQGRDDPPVGAPLLDRGARTDDADGLRTLPQGVPSREPLVHEPRVEEA